MREVLSPSGFLPVNKPAGITSFDVIRELRRMLRIKKLGHSGVLDKPATGVLVIGANQATRLFELFGHFEKEYVADIWFGLTTSTDDTSGELTASAGAPALTAEAVAAVLGDYTGVIDQIPPAFSLTKVGGKELYRYALSGKDVVAKPKRVTVYGIELVDFTGGLSVSDAAEPGSPLATQLSADIVLSRAQVKVSCQGGVYVRSIARDIGADLGVGGSLGNLVRTRVGPFTLANSPTLEALASQLSDDVNPADMLLPISSIAPLEQQLALDAQQLSMVRNGRSIRRFKHHLPPGAAKRGDVVYGMNPGRELAVILTVGEINQHGLVELKPSKVLA